MNLEFPAYLSGPSDLIAQRSQVVICNILSELQVDPAMTSMGMIFDDVDYLTRVTVEFSDDFSEMTIRVKNKPK